VRYLAQRRWGETARRERAMPHRIYHHIAGFFARWPCPSAMKGHDMKLAAFVPSDSAWPVLTLVVTALLTSTALTVTVVASLCVRQGAIDATDR
jgi:hypothetical protein